MTNEKGYVNRFWEKENQPDYQSLTVGAWPDLQGLADELVTTCVQRDQSVVEHLYAKRARLRAAFAREAIEACWTCS